MNRDLFGEARAPDLTGSVTLRMVVHRATDKAWLLSKDGERAAPQWVPKSRVVRGEGRDEDLWTMTKVTAHERGWL